MLTVGELTVRPVAPDDIVRARTRATTPCSRWSGRPYRNRWTRRLRTVGGAGRGRDVPGRRAADR
ncbi:hypothetical protein NKH77_47150 [Streptomyces sp. M19]